MTCIFTCDLCTSEFKSKAYNVLTGYWCPFCKKKTEAKVLAFLATLEGEWDTQLRREWCRFSATGNVMPIDFGSVAHHMTLELDGPQHFKQISNWNGPEEVQEKDLEKIKACLSNGYHHLRMTQEEVWKDKYDWKHMLLATITRLQTTSTPQCIFISNTEKYVQHQTTLDASGIPYEKVRP